MDPNGGDSVVLSKSAQKKLEKKNKIDSYKTPAAAAPPKATSEHKEKTTTKEKKSKNEPEKKKPESNIPKVAHLKTFGGDSKPISIDDIFQKMDALYPDWKDPSKTFLFPAISEPKYEGPVGLPGVEEKTENGHMDHVKGHECEIKVLDSFFNYSETIKAGLKIFHDVRIQREKMEALCDAFGTSMPEISKDTLAKFKHEMIELEIDLLTFNRNTMCLTEVKSNADLGFKAMEQLERAEIIVRILLKIIGVKEITINKLVAVPPPDQVISHQMKVKKIPVFEIGASKNIQTLEETHPTQGSGVLTDDEMKKLIATFTFMKCSHYYPKRSLDQVTVEETEMKEGLIKALKAHEIMKKFDSQVPLKKWKNSEVEEFDRKNLFFLLHDHVSENLLNDEKQRKMVFDSSEMVSFVALEDLMNKIREICNENIFQDVLIIVPSKKVAEKFEEQIREHLNEEQMRSIQIKSERDNKDPWQKCLNCPVFIHEASIPGVISEKSQFFSNHKMEPIEEDLIWLDANQSKIMNSKNPRQLIIGPASTGKTVLIQLKVLELLKRKKKCLILLPSKRLVEKYQQFFERASINLDSKTFFITTLEDENWKEFFESNSPHVFIDEFCALYSSSNHSCKELLKRIPNMPTSNLLWLSIDFKQGLDFFEEDLMGHLEYLSLEYVSITHLLMVHRCTSNVFKKFKAQCGPLIALGHQFEGDEVRLVSPTANDEDDIITVWGRAILLEIEDQKKNGWTNDDICVILASKCQNSSKWMLSLYLEIKCFTHSNGIQITFENQTLSQEWPVVINCCFEGTNPYISLSRAIYNLTIIVKPTKPCGLPEEIVFPPTLDLYSATLNSNSLLLRVKCDPSIEMIIYHQEMHNRKVLRYDEKVFSFLSQNLAEYVSNLNFYIGASLLDENSTKEFKDSAMFADKLFFDGLRQTNPPRNTKLEEFFSKLLSDEGKLKLKTKVQNLTSIKCRDTFFLLKMLVTSIEGVIRWQSQVLRLTQHYVKVKPELSMVALPLRSLVHLCKDKTILQSLGYGHLLQNLSFIEDLKIAAINNDNSQEELNIFCEQIDKNVCDNQQFREYLMALFCCYSNELSHIVNQQLLTELESLQTHLTSETSSQNWILQLDHLDKSISASINEHPQVKSFYDKLMSAKSRKEFLADHLFPSFSNRDTKTTLFDVKFCRACLFTYNPNQEAGKNVVETTNNHEKGKHEKFVCNGCQKRSSNEFGRHHCTVCSSFDLCKECSSKKTKRHRHPMVEMSQGIQISENENSLLHIACKERSQKKIKHLLRNGGQINAKDEEGNTPLHTAAWKNYLTIVQFLLSKGADKESCDNLGQRVIHLVAWKGYLELLKKLVEHGVETEVFDYDLNTPLHLAALRGQCSVIEYLLKNGANPVSKNTDGSTPLHLASSSGHLIAVQCLLKHSADIDVCDNDLKTPLHLAAKNGHSSTFNYLLNEGANQEARDRQGMSALHIAAVNGCTLVVNHLLLKGSDIEDKTFGKSTALYLAVWKSHMNLVQILIKHGADVNTKNSEGASPIHVASTCDVEICKLLLDNGANINAKTNLAQTALMMSVYYSKIEIVKLFLEMNADINETDSFGKTALHYAAGISNPELLQVLLNKGAKLEAKDSIGDTPLHLAAGQGKINNVEKLFINGAKLEEINTLKRTALHVAALRGHHDIVKYLLEIEAQPNAEDERHETPLHCAIYFGKLETVELLVKYEANIEAKDIDGLTPLHVASMQGHTAIVKFLISKNAQLEAKTINEDTKQGSGVALGHKQGVECLPESGAKIEEKNNQGIHAKTKNGDTILGMGAALGHIQIVECLLDAGAEIEEKNIQGINALLAASGKGHTDIVQHLLMRGADIKAHDINKHTCLHAAAHHGFLDVVQKLIEHGANIDAKSKQGRTPLHMSANSGFLHVVKYLISQGANIEARDGQQFTKKPAGDDANNQQGQTALELAQTNGHLHVVEYLKQLSAEVKA